MVTSCNAPGCSWERATANARGLSRHRATCRFYHKASVLACQKRRERAKQAARTPSLQPVRTSKPGLAYSSQILPVQHGDSRKHFPKPIMTVPCKPTSRLKTQNGTSPGAAGLEHFQPPSKQRQFDTDVDSDNAFQPNDLAREEPSRPLRPIP